MSISMPQIQGQNNHSNEFASHNTSVIMLISDHASESAKGGSQLVIYIII